MERIVFHIDVNSAFLSWTAVQMLLHGEKLDIRTVPSVVSGDPQDRRSIVTAKSIPAKKYGSTRQSRFDGFAKMSRTGGRAR